MKKKVNINFPYTIEKRKDIGLFLNSVSILVALLASIVIASVLISIFGADVSIVLMALAKGSFGSMSALIDTLIKATPIMLTGLATIVALSFGRVSDKDSCISWQSPPEMECRSRVSQAIL